MSTVGEPADQFVQSLDRGLVVIRALNLPSPQSVSDVARTTNLSRATARRFLLTLQHLGYVREADGRFSLTPKVLDLGYAYLSSLTLADIAQPHLESLVEDVHESSSVSILDFPDIVYVARVPTHRIMTVAISVGTRFPAFATSMGRVLLAGLDDDALASAARHIEFSSLTAKTITTRKVLEQELLRIRRQGWALVDQELEQGLRSIAAPIRDADGTVAAALNLSVSASTMSARDMKRDLLPALLETASSIERDIAAGRAGRKVARA
jgi:IclR family transcriptional regulator, pca regulon regulatory protein